MCMAKYEWILFRRSMCWSKCNFITVRMIVYKLLKILFRKPVMVNSNGLKHNCPKTRWKIRVINRKSNLLIVLKKTATVRSLITEYLLRRKIYTIICLNFHHLFNLLIVNLCSLVSAWNSQVTAIYWVLQ